MVCLFFPLLFWNLVEESEHGYVASVVSKRKERSLETKVKFLFMREKMSVQLILLLLVVRLH